MLKSGYNICHVVSRAVIPVPVLACSILNQRGFAANKCSCDKVDLRINSGPAKRPLVLVSLDWIRAKDPSLPLGTASILAHAKANGVSDQIAVVQRNMASGPDILSLMQEIVTRAEGLASDFKTSRIDVAFGAFVWNESLVQDAISLLKKERWGGRIILGGPQVSYARLASLEDDYPHADIFVRGNAEQPVVRLLQVMGLCR